MPREGNGRYGGNYNPVGVSEDRPKADPPDCESQVHGVPHVAVEPPNRFGGATGAGVPWPVHLKSQTQRRATANPITDGTAASHRQRDALLFPRGNRATPAAARTIRRRTPCPRPAPPPSSAIDPPA